MIAMQCAKRDGNCECDLRQTPVGVLCGWHSATFKWCDHCLNARLDKVILIDGLRDETVQIKLCESCYTKLLDTMKAGS